MPKKRIVKAKRYPKDSFKPNMKVKSSGGKKGVIYIGNLPRGLNDSTLPNFFSQFGTVTRFRMARSNRTGNTMGYAYAEFLYRKVAEIVVKVMHHHFMYGRILKCYILPDEKVTPNTFRNVNKSAVDCRRVTKQRNNQLMLDATSNTKTEIRRLKKLKKKLTTMKTLSDGEAEHIDEDISATDSKIQKLKS